ncbi:MAG: glycosyltransferase family 2 protein [Clostridia bacterium]|nr:glycosyltransferase family 2 protein [Clostridia bacterium]
MRELAIVIVAYNRVHSLKRLLKSIAQAEYDRKDIPLIISVDRGEQNIDVVRIAEDFDWEYGSKKVVYQQENLGLKQHILQCGDYTKEYGSIIMLEDDLYVSPAFYLYARKALDFTEQMDQIAGVSLYNHLFNVHTREPFSALEDGFSNWYMQFASSWGQAWTCEQWLKFKSWLLSRENDEQFDDPRIPHNVASWSDHSWLKYFIKYMIENDLYFLYPRISLTTNFFDEGQHAKKAVTDLQVPLAGRKQRAYHFSSLEQSEAVYDAFFENSKLEQKMKEFLQTEELCVIDLYGYKTQKSRYLLSGACKPYQVLARFGCRLRPMDANIYEETEGDYFFLYDTSVQGKKPKKADVDQYLYHYRALKSKYMVKLLFYRIKEAISIQKSNQ